MAENQTVIELIGVTKTFNLSENVAPLNILTNVNLRVGRGESLAIVGPSGSGKSTLLNILGALDRPSQGSVRLNGRELTALSEAEIAEVRNRQVGFVFQEHHLLPHCTVVENVLVPTLASMNASQRADAGARAVRLLRRVGLAERMHHLPSQLSGGEKQRVAVVRALINQPPLVLGDEPTGALDSASALDLSQLLIQLNREENLTLIVVTHSSDLAARLGKTLELRDGQLRESTPPNIR
jgi:lipoprotein-releasing system ATP-binding protein